MSGRKNVSKHFGYIVLYENHSLQNSPWGKGGERTHIYAMANRLAIKSFVYLEILNGFAINIKGRCFQKFLLV